MGTEVGFAASYLLECLLLAVDSANHYPRCRYGPLDVYTQGRVGVTADSCQDRQESPIETLCV